jgi:Protein of unknwon function (DUF3310)
MQAPLTAPMNVLPSSKDWLPPTEQPSQKTAPLVRHPAHYNKGKYEVIDVIEDWNMGFNLGNVIKYVARADHKGEPTVDLYKALFYLQREIGNRERT